MHCGKRGHNQLGVFVGVRVQGPGFQCQRVVVTQPREALPKFSGEQSPVKTDALQDGFAELQKKEYFFYKKQKCLFFTHFENSEILPQGSAFLHEWRSHE